MTVNKLVLIGMLSVAAVFTADSDALAFGKKNKGCGGGSSCGGGCSGGYTMASSCSPCGTSHHHHASTGCSTCSGAVGGYAMAGGCSTCGGGYTYAGTLTPMGSSVTVMVPGTMTPMATATDATTTVVAGTVTGTTAVVPTSGVVTTTGYVMPAGGVMTTNGYVMPVGGYTNQGYAMPYSTGSTRTGLFRR